MSDPFRIRPAGRHILTVGRELIKDQFAAIVELVKNAYDADAETVRIEFRTNVDNKGYTVSIADDGHGMTKQTVVDAWLVPSTGNKATKQISPKGRILQGRKGIGRYAAAILGEDLLMESVTSEGEKTSVYLQWSDFENAQYLDQVDVIVDTEQTDQLPGTMLAIQGSKERLKEWDAKQVKTLIIELKKLLAPTKLTLANGQRDKFRITLERHDFPASESGVQKEDIKPFPIFDFYDYRISGTVRGDTGTGKLEYVLQKSASLVKKSITIDMKGPTGCGDLAFDIRVFDREGESIDALVKKGKGLKQSDGSYVGKVEARRILDENSGLGVFRNGFRIRPLGDPDFDWLQLNKERVQNPSMRIGSNQVMGYVLVQSEEQSKLIEKSARDGLRENNAYDRLYEITTTVIRRLEEERYQYRKKAGLSRPALKIEEQLEHLYSYDDLKERIQKTLDKARVDPSTTSKVLKALRIDAEEKNVIADTLRQAVAIYQGQATLGKIINVILHEGRRPLNCFANQVPNLEFQIQQFRKDPISKNADKIFSTSSEIAKAGKDFVSLFKRLDPLASRQRGRAKNLDLSRILSNSFAIFDSEIQRQNVSVKIDEPRDYIFRGWEQDLAAIFVNLIENSLYWMNEDKSPSRIISVLISLKDGKLQHIDYRDTGPGISSDLIENEVIFEPHFSTKADGGTGIGLTIAGESASRCGLRLIAMASETGAHFQLQNKD